MTKVVKTRTSRVRQGDIIRDVEYIEYAVEKSGQIEIAKIVFPLVYVLTQDCDLEQDYRFRWSQETGLTQDKWLLSILVAPLYNIEHVYAGEHLSELHMQMEPINRRRSPGMYLRNNERPRFHYLEFPTDIPIVPSVIDFKHYFSVNVQYLKQLKKKNFVCSVGELFRENIANRFSGYLARVGLPEPTP